MATKRRGRWYHKILLSLTSLILFLGLSELVCWSLKLAPTKRAPFKFVARSLENDVAYPFIVEDSILLWSPKPGFRGRECYYGVDVRINAAGFRDREYPLTKAPDVFRILCLGDSTTFGHGLPIDDTYHDLLEEILNLVDRSPGLRYELINGGVPGYSSTQCLAAYEHRGRKLRPDLVLLNAGPNDLRGRCHLSDDQLLERCRPGVVRSLDDALSNLHSYRTLHRCISGLREYLDQNGPKTVPRVDPDAFKRNIARLDESCKADGCRLVLISFAYCREISRDRFDEAQLEGDFARHEGLILAQRDALETVARERHIPLVTVPALTEKTSTPNRALFFDMFHPNRGGHLVLALALEQFLRVQGLLPEVGPLSATEDAARRNDTMRKFLQDRGYLAEAGQFPSRASNESPGTDGDKETPH